ncbi:MAG: CRISPR-associated endonuclease Cas2 [Candidatus Eremiobacteraeota bacterium]|nr:CRISPR-associated endonuclease Cas2 [Candidatus Eremiobacteraeota bacterium]
MRRDFIVTYDVSNDKRLRLVFKAMLGFGEHIQFSVFRCALSKMERQKMIEKLTGLIHQREDQVLIIELGTLPERRSRIRPLGRAYRPCDPGAQVF